MEGAARRGSIFQVVERYYKRRRHIHGSIHVRTKIFSTSVASFNICESRVVTVCTTQISIVFAAKSSMHVSIGYMVLLGFLSNPTLLSIAGRRMLINMKELGARGGLRQVSSSGTRTSSVGTIGFVAPRISGQVTVSYRESDTFELQVRSDLSLS